MTIYKLIVIVLLLVILQKNKNMHGTRIKIKEESLDSRQEQETSFLRMACTGSGAACNSRFGDKDKFLVPTRNRPTIPRNCGLVTTPTTPSPLLIL